MWWDLSYGTHANSDLAMVLHLPTHSADGFDV